MKLKLPDGHVVVSTTYPSEVVKVEPMQPMLLSGFLTGAFDEPDSIEQAVRAEIEREEKEKK